MRRIAGIILALSLTLGGCAQLKEALTPRDNPIKTANLYEAELVFDGAVKTFNALKGLCVRRVIPSTCRSYVILGQQGIQKAYAADKAARNFVRNNPTLDATNVIQAFTGLVSDFQGNVSNLSSLRAQ